jgi:hypothetical protein
VKFLPAGDIDGVLSLLFNKFHKLIDDFIKKKQGGKNSIRNFVYLVFDISRTAGGDKNSGQFTSSHGGGDVQRRISVLISSTNHFIF